MAHGGNAIDATDAALFTLTVVEPMMVGIFGGGTAVIRLADGRELVIDGLATAPAMTRPDSYTPVSYDYGVNLTAQDGNVLLNGQSIGTTAQFSQQAADLAATGWAADVSPTDEWFPLGVYTMVRNEQQHGQFIVQLAINKQGILRGNYTDDVSDHTLPIRGAVDKNSQRAAWTVGDNKQTVMEAGLLELTENETPALIHKGGKTDHWLLVRLIPPSAAPN
jgi:hypothetical protein